MAWPLYVKRQVSEYQSVGDGTATIMLMGDVYTRACKFYAVNTGNPLGWLDTEEPIKLRRQ